MLRCKNGSSYSFHILIGAFKPERFKRKLSITCQLSHVAINRRVVFSELNEKNKQRIKRTIYPIYCRCKVVSKWCRPCTVTSSLTLN